MHVFSSFATWSIPKHDFSPTPKSILAKPFFQCSHATAPGYLHAQNVLFSQDLDIIQLTDHQARAQRLQCAPDLTICRVHVLLCLAHSYCDHLDRDIQYLIVSADSDWQFQNWPVRAPCNWGSSDACLPSLSTVHSLDIGDQPDICTLACPVGMIHNGHISGWSGARNTSRLRMSR